MTPRFAAVFRRSIIISVIAVASVFSHVSIAKSGTDSDAQGIAESSQASQPSQSPMNSELEPTQVQLKVPEMDYSNADAAAEVLQVQFDLRKLGFYIGELNGLLSDETLNAIRSYQLEQMLDIDGVVTDELRSSLEQKTGRFIGGQ